jgi:hypothetical protein
MNVDISINFHDLSVWPRLLTLELVIGSWRAPQYGVYLEMAVLHGQILWLPVWNAVTLERKWLGQTFIYISYSK